MFEAEMSDGDISQVAQLLQNALQPRQAPVKVVQVSSAAALVDGTLDPDEADELVEEELDREASAQRPRTTRTRSIRPPKVVDGIDWETEPSLRDFASEYDIKTDFER
jgi:hypothetical protein